jgi:hypothetical protein
MSEDSSLELFALMREFGEERKWHLKYAKFNWRVHQSLLAHSLNVSSLAISILDYLVGSQIIKLTNKLRLQMLLTGFLHDAGKESELFQRAVERFLSGEGAEPLDFGHQQERDIRSVVESLQKYVSAKFQFAEDLHGIWEEVIWSVSHMGKMEDAGAVSQSFTRANSNDALICKEVVHIADVMMSKLSVEDAARTALNGQTVSKLQLTYSKVSTVRGVLTQFLHAALEAQFDGSRFKAVQWFPNGTVYVGRADTTAPHMDSAKLVESLVKSMQQFLYKLHSRQIARAAYGSLTAQVIAAPEFLFARDGDDVIHQFWQYITTQRFAKPNYKDLDKLKDTEKRIYSRLSRHLGERDRSTKLIFLARFLADFNLLIVLYAARSQLVENAKKVGVKTKIIEEATKQLQIALAQGLTIPLALVANWPEIALQTKAEKRLAVAETLWKSPHYEKPEVWRRKMLDALENATVALARRWRNCIPDKCSAIARLLLEDISHPLDPTAIVKTIKTMDSVIDAGKTGHGTSNCQRCGGIATCEAQAELFGQSEIYHDNLVVSSRVGGGNKIRVCELCEFEEKLHSVFARRQQQSISSFYIFPQLALSRNQRLDWQKIANEIQYDPSRFPPLLRVNRWAEIMMEGDDTRLPLRSTGFSFSDKERVWGIQEIALENGFLDDLSPMILPPLEAKDASAVVSLINQGKCKLNERFEKALCEIINRMSPIYISPNFILVLASGTVADRDENQSSAAIKWAFFRCVLARLFYATVLSADAIRMEDMLGYTTLPSSIILRPLTEKLGARDMWIPIPKLEMALRRLSALILIGRELSSADASYGNATLLRLLIEEPGRVLMRMTNKNPAYPKKLVSYLDAWSQ